jgi:hypothetical protein
MQATNRPRWTGYADTLPEEDELAEPPAGPSDPGEEFFELEDDPEMALPADDLDPELAEMAIEEEPEAAAEADSGAEIGADETEPIEQ